MFVKNEQGEYVFVQTDGQGSEVQKSLSDLAGRPIEQEATELPESGQGETDSTLWERTKASFANPDIESKLAAWKKITGAPVRESKHGGVDVYRDGSWRPVDEEGFSLGDIADVVGDVPEVVLGTIGGIGGAALGGGVTPIGGVMGALGASTGSLAGTSIRQKAGEMIGLPELEGKGKEARQESVAYGAVGELLPIGVGAGKYIARKAGDIGATIGSGLIGAPKESIKALASERGASILAKTGLGDTGATNYGKKLYSLKEAAKERASQRYEQALDIPTETADSFKNAPLELGEIPEELATEAIERGLITKTGEVSPKLAKEFAPQAKSALEKLEELGYQDTIGDLLRYRKDIDDVLKNLGGYNESPKSSKYIGFLKTLRGKTEQLIEDNAHIHGIGDEYKAAKNAYKERIGVFNSLDKILKREATATGKVRNFESKAQVEMRQALDRLTQLEPDLDSTVAEIKDYVVATQFDEAVPRNLMDSGRMGAAVAGNIVGTLDTPQAIGTGMALLSARPAHVKGVIEGAGRKLRPIGEAVQTGLEAIGVAKPKVAIGTAEPLDIVRVVSGGEMGDPIGNEVIQQAFEGITPLGKVSVDATGTIDGVAVNNAGDIFINPTRYRDSSQVRKAVIEATVSPNLIAEEIEPHIPDLISWAKSHYGANFKRAIDNGMSETDAALAQAADLFAKGKGSTMRKVLTPITSKIKAFGLNDSDVNILLEKAVNSTLGIQPITTPRKILSGVGQTTHMRESE